MSDLDELLACNRQELVKRWRRTCASSPPKHTSTQLMQKTLAFDLQAKALGDVNIRSRRVLKHMLKMNHRASNGADTKTLSRMSGGADGAKSSSLLVSGCTLSAGVQLVREWHGRTWRVDVLEDGFICNGKTYRSLSAIARMITGTQWSGPRFFGLTP